MKIKRRYDCSEPQHCLARDCNEEYNGLNNFWFNIGKDFRLETWLCNDCAKKIKKLIK